MIFLYVLGSKESLFSPEIPVGSMLVTLYQKQSWRHDSFRMDKVTGSRNRFFVATLDTILRNSL